MTESFAAFVNRLGLVPRRGPRRGLSSSTLTKEQVEDLAVAAYWRNRPTRREPAA